MVPAKVYPRRIILLTLLLSLFAVPAPAQQKQAGATDWFSDAKLGIFIHWGIYSVNGIDESWSFYNGYISYADYMKQLDGFTASAYDPDSWVKLIKESGAQYAGLTTKHHDGVALWNTKLGRLNVVDSTPAGRDLIESFVKALRKAGLKTGLYYSLLDWSHPDYPNFTKAEKRYETDSVRWELCMTINDSWGYQGNDTNYKESGLLQQEMPG